LQAGGHRRADLHDTAVEGAGEGVDFGQGLKLHAEFRARHGIGVGIELLVRAARGLGQGAASVTYGKACGLGCAQERRLGDFSGMCIARDLAPHGAQAKSLRGIVGGGLHPAIVKQQHF